MKPCRPPNSPLASAKPSCNSPRRVRKRSNNSDCYSEKKGDRASGKAFALPGYGGLRRSGRISVQDSLRLKNRLLSFSGRNTRTISTNRLPLSSTHRSVPPSFSPSWERKRIRFNGDISPVRFISATEHRIARAILERDRARAMNELAGLETFVSFLFSCSQVCIPS